MQRTLFLLGGLVLAGCSSSSEPASTDSGGANAGGATSTGSSAGITSSTGSSGSGASGGGGSGVTNGGSGISSGGTNGVTSGGSTGSLGGTTGSASASTASASTGSASSTTGGTTIVDASAPEAGGTNRDAGPIKSDAAGPETGSPADAAADARKSSSFVCNEVLGIDTTSEWFLGGFETYVSNDRWQLIYYHPGYVEDWASASDPVWSAMTTSPCTMNSNNPDRVIFNATNWTYTTSMEWVTTLTQVVELLKKKYSNLKRIDLLTLTRAPNNQVCMTGNDMSIVQPFVDDAIAKVAAAYPGLVTASPKFFAPSCDVFTSGGPHFTDQGKPIIAKLYGNYYASEP